MAVVDRSINLGHGYPWKDSIAGKTFVLPQDYMQSSKSYMTSNPYQRSTSSFIDTIQTATSPWPVPQVGTSQGIPPPSNEDKKPLPSNHRSISSSAYQTPPVASVVSSLSSKTREMLTTVSTPSSSASPYSAGSISQKPAAPLNPYYSLTPYQLQQLHQPRVAPPPPAGHPRMTPGPVETSSPAPPPDYIAPEDRLRLCSADFIPKLPPSRPSTSTATTSSVTSELIEANRRELAARHRHLDLHPAIPMTTTATASSVITTSNNTVSTQISDTLESEANAKPSGGYMGEFFEYELPSRYHHHYHQPPAPVENIPYSMGSEDPVSSYSGEIMYPGRQSMPPPLPGFMDSSTGSLLHQPVSSTQPGYLANYFSSGGQVYPQAPYRPRYGQYYTRSQMSDLDTKSTSSTAENLENHPPPLSLPSDGMIKESKRFEDVLSRHYSAPTRTSSSTSHRHSSLLRSQTPPPSKSSSNLRSQLANNTAAPQPFSTSKVDPEIPRTKSRPRSHSVEDVDRSQRKDEFDEVSHCTPPSHLPPRPHSELGQRTPRSSHRSHSLERPQSANLDEHQHRRSLHSNLRRSRQSTRNQNAVKLNGDQYSPTNGTDNQPAPPTSSSKDREHVTTEPLDAANNRRSPFLPSGSGVRRSTSSLSMGASARHKEQNRFNQPSSSLNRHSSYNSADKLGNNFSRFQPHGEEPTDSEIVKLLQARILKHAQNQFDQKYLPERSSSSKEWDKQRENSHSSTSYQRSENIQDSHKYRDEMTSFYTDNPSKNHMFQSAYMKRVMDHGGPREFHRDHHLEHSYPPPNNWSNDIRPPNESFLDAMRRGGSIFPSPQISGEPMRSKDPKVESDSRSERALEERILQDEEVAARNALTNSLTFSGGLSFSSGSSYDMPFDPYRRPKSSGPRSVTFADDVKVAHCFESQASPLHLSWEPLNDDGYPHPPQPIEGSPSSSSFFNFPTRSPRFHGNFSSPRVPKLWRPEEGGPPEPALVGGGDMEFREGPIQTAAGAPITPRYPFWPPPEHFTGGNRE